MLVDLSHMTLIEHNYTPLTGCISTKLVEKMGTGLWEIPLNLASVPHLRGRYWKLDINPFLQDLFMQCNMMVIITMQSEPVPMGFV